MHRAGEAVLLSRGSTVMDQKTYSSSVSFESGRSWQLKQCGRDVACNR